MCRPPLPLRRVRGHRRLRRAPCKRRCPPIAGGRACWPMGMSCHAPSGSAACSFAIVCFTRLNRRRAQWMAPAGGVGQRRVGGLSGDKGRAPACQARTLPANTVDRLPPPRPRPPPARTRDGRHVARRWRRARAARERLARRADLAVELLQDVRKLVHHLLADCAARLDGAEVGEQLEGALRAAQLAERGVDQLALRARGGGGRGGVHSAALVSLASTSCRVSSTQGSLPFG